MLADVAREDVSALIEELRVLELEDRGSIVTIEIDAESGALIGIVVAALATLTVQRALYDRRRIQIRR